MEKLANKLTDYIIKKNVISEESSEIYAYGFQMGLEMLFNILVGSITALYINMFMEYIIIIIIFVAVRSYTGGVHFDTFLKCFVCSYVVQLGILLWSDCIKYPLSISLVIILLMYLFIFRLTPVENINRPVDNEEQRYFKKKLKYILGIIFIVVIALSIWNLKEYVALIANTLVIITISMLIGKIKYIKLTQNLSI